MGVITAIIGFILAHPSLILGVASGGAGLGFIAFKTAFLDFITNPRVMICIAAVVGVLCFASLHNENVALKQSNAALVSQVQSIKDGQAAVVIKLKKQAVNATHQTQIQQAREAAPVGQKTDAVLDTIAQQASGSSDSPGPVHQPDGVCHDGVGCIKP